MKFYCKKCQNKFDEKYNDLFDHLKCPNCSNKEIVLNFLLQGILPPQDGFGLAFWEFEDVLETGNESYLKDFFEEEFNLRFSRIDEEFSLLDEKNKETDLKEVFKRTQKDGKLQRKLYNIYYVLLHHGT
ncbi:MAG: hypothetical protein KGD64_15020 [Candidatus Heimdallarchaeota archaeon]|nr:hypothetical protein [Candidatus Heimdallarchaeota archaeon]